MSKHANTGKCIQCQAVLNRYPGFHKGLRTWFEELQAKHPEAHISCAGRGRMDQEAAVLKKASRAHFGKSSHNWNAALDLFELGGQVANIYEDVWFDKVLAPQIPDWIEWYGKPGSKFFERAHVELKSWRELSKTGELQLIDEDANVRAA